MTEYIKVNAIQIHQDDKDFYLFKMKAGDLLSIAFVNPREIDRESGIQRTLKEARAKEIAEYIDSEGALLPNSIIINLQSKFIKIGKDSLEIKSEKGSTFVIDGQHRLKAFDYSKQNDFELPVSAFVDLSVAEIAEIFVKINYYQKPVNKSLVYDLLGISKKLFPDYVEAHEITKTLNLTIGSPWFNQIKMLGIGKGIITQATFITSLEENKILKNVLGKFKIDEKIKILSNYFEAIKQLFPQQWGHRGSIVSKSVGIHAFVKIFPNVFSNVVKNSGGFRVDAIIKYIAPIQKIQFDSEEISSLGGKKGVSTLAAKLTEQLSGKGK